jgi:hypothetical protein
LLVQRLLLCTRDMTVIEFRHRALLASDLAVLLAQLARLGLSEIAFIKLSIDAPAQIRKAIVDLLATPMGDSPMGIPSPCRSVF